MTDERVSSGRPQLNIRMAGGFADLFDQLRAVMADVPGEPLGATETIRRLVIAEAKRRKLKPRGRNSGATPRRPNGRES